MPTAMSTFVISCKSKTGFKRYNGDASVSGRVLGPRERLANCLAPGPVVWDAFSLDSTFLPTSLDLQIKTVKDSPPPLSVPGEAGR